MLSGVWYTGYKEFKIFFDFCEIFNRFLVFSDTRRIRRAHVPTVPIPLFLEYVYLDSGSIGRQGSLHFLSTQGVNLRAVL